MNDVEVKNTPLDFLASDRTPGFNPKVSIVIPVYNGSNFLREAIDSALAQTYNNIEVIVINDGSTDEGETEKIAKSYGDRIMYLSKENGGVSSALNLGIREMSGDYFSWLSHDDLYYPEKIEMQILFLSKNPHLQAVFSNSEIINADGVTSYVQKTAGPNAIRGPFHVLQTWIFACALLVHRKCLEKIGLFNESNRTTQDIEFVMNLLHSYDVGHLRQVLVRRRDHEECGYYRFRDLNQFELETLLGTILRSRGIGFFFPHIKTCCDLKAEAKAYELLGDLTAHAGIPFSRDCYEISAQILPSLLNPARYKKMMGRRIAYLCARFGAMIRTMSECSR